mmetsp:Transcript_30054/g.42899  ORF Transcript_30054/g.42899 Transcript_30054/m.42899 type:complete len:382 (-) Transcript_30054:375-1520(-)
MMNKLLFILGLCRFNSRISLLKRHHPYKFPRFVSQMHSTDTNSYAFLDCGNLKRLEKFGSLLVSRSCPSAKWKPAMAESFWKSANNLIYEGNSGKVGEWTKRNSNNDCMEPVLSLDGNWNVNIDNMMFHLSPSEMGQVGVFPEQKENWVWIQQKLSSALGPGSKTKNVLNGFAYTGGSTMASLRVPGVKVVHLDSSKAFVQTAKRNVELTGLSDRPVRWIVDDCLTFLRREIRRRDPTNDNSTTSTSTSMGQQGKTSKDKRSRSAQEFCRLPGGYDGLIFDPPAFGRAGAKGKTWHIEKDLPELLELLPKLLSVDPVFVLISCHDSRWPADRLLEHLEKALNPLRLGGSYETGPLELHSSVSSRSLPLGCYVRWSRIRLND